MDTIRTTRPKRAPRLQTTPKVAPDTYLNLLYITQIAQSRFPIGFALEPTWK
jgi:hypothetical protein